jgi:hypothetical protein
LSTLKFLNSNALKLLGVSGLKLIGRDNFTKMLLHFNGNDGSTSIIDEVGKTIFVGGDAQIDTAQYKFNSSACLFDGTGDYLQITDANNDLDIGTNDFTIEFWVRFNNVTGAQILVDFRQTAPDNLVPVIQKNSSHKLVYATEGGSVITGTTTIAINTWYHVAVSRYNGTTKMFVNGTQEGDNYTDTNNYISVTSIVIGGRYTVDSSMLNGWIDEIMLTKGLSRYINNFVVPDVEFS